MDMNDSFNWLFFGLGDKLTEQRYFHCLAATETKCDSQFSTEITRPKLISLFKHLLEVHPPHYDSITQVEYARS
jgi:hypothetical protein